MKVAEDEKNWTHIVHWRVGFHVIIKLLLIGVAPFLPIKRRDQENPQ